VTREALTVTGYVDASGVAVTTPGGAYRSVMVNSSDNGTFYAVDSGGTQRVLVTSNGSSYFNGGNVGIGTTAPTNKLQFGNLIDTATATPATLSLGGTYSSSAGVNPKLKLYESSTAFYGLGVSAWSMDYMVPATARHTWFIDGTEKMRLNANGNVGIGTSSPSATLDINGDIKTSGAVSYGSLKDFRMVYRDDFQSAATGWSMTTRSACGDATILGGYNVTAGTSFYRDFDLTGISHTEVMVRLTYYHLDSWDGEYAYVQVGGVAVHSRAQIQSASGLTNICGITNVDYVIPVEGRITHSGNTLRVLVGSTLDQGATDESFGIDNVEIWVR
jgi:hypothetical protein